MHINCYCMLCVYHVCQSIEWQHSNDVMWRALESLGGDKHQPIHRTDVYRSRKRETWAMCARDLFIFGIFYQQEEIQSTTTTTNTELVYSTNESLCRLTLSDICIFYDIRFSSWVSVLLIFFRTVILFRFAHSSVLTDFLLLNKQSRRI